MCCFYRIIFSVVFFLDLGPPSLTSFELEIPTVLGFGSRMVTAAEKKRSLYPLGNEIPSAEAALLISDATGIDFALLVY